MFELGWTELLLIGVVALIVVGPKDLPVLFRNVGRFIGKARGMAREFSRAMEDAADESGVRDMAKSIKSVADPKQMGLDKIREAADDLTAWKPGSETAKLAAERAQAAAKLREQTTPEALAAKSDSAKSMAAAQQASSTPIPKPATPEPQTDTAPKAAATPKAAAKPKAAAAKATASKSAPTGASAKPAPQSPPQPQSRTRSKAQPKAKAADPKAQE